MDISINLAFTIIICVTIICATAIMWQVIKYLINQNKAKQKISNFNTKTIKKFTSFKYPWIYKKTTTTNNPSNNNELTNNESK